MWHQTSNNTNPMKKTILVLSLALASPLAAQNLESLSMFSASRFGIGAHAGTHGVGGHITYDLYDWVYFRAEASGISIDVDENIDGVDYEAGLDLLAGGLTAHFHPFKDIGFRIGLGVYATNDNADVTASKPGQTVKIGNARTYTLGRGQSVTGNIDYSVIAPYLGIGWDFDFGERDQFTFSIDAGVLYIGEPDIELRTNSINPVVSGITRREINREIDSIRDELDSYEFYPVARIGFTWHF